MDAKTLQDLEFNVFLDFLSTYASSLSGKRAVKVLMPLFNSKEIEKKYKYIKEIKAWLWDPKFPLPQVPDLSFIFKQRPPEGILNPTDIFLVGQFLTLGARIKKYWEERQREAPSIWDMLQDLDPLIPLRQTISRSVNAKGEVLDSASPQLKGLRENVQNLKAKIRETLNQLLESPSYKSFWQEKLIFLRQNRYVVALKSEYQPFLKGIVHDYSRSKATCFIEPLEILPLNNELQVAIKEAEEEEKRILKSLTQAIQHHAEVFERNQKILTALDVFIAIGKFARDYDCSFPIFDKNLFFKEVRHPILYWQEKRHHTKRVVPINLHLERDKRVVIISGPNAGGKTVALKTLGLCVLMAQSGIPIPAAEAVMPVFQAVFSDIGDDQNLIYEMSTFSAHLKRLNEIEAQAREGALVLIDEMGKGTNPTEGVALSMAFLDALRQKGAQVVVTTHFDGLKVYGLKEKGVLNVAVGFDTRDFKPTYQLHYGSFGTSFAIEIARKMGLRPYLLEKAHFYLQKIGGKAVEVISEIMQLKEELRQKRQFVVKLLQKIILLHKRQKKLVGEIEAQKAEIYHQYKARLDALLENIERNIRGLSKKKQGPLKTIEGLQRQKQILKEVKANLAAKVTPEPSLVPGCWVKLSAQLGHKIAQVKKITPEAVEVTVGSLRFQIPFASIEKVVDSPPHLPQGVNVKTQSAPTSEVYLLGKRVDEALPEIEKAIDTALLCGLKQIRIVHGLGTGRLRAAIWDHLKTLPQVAEFTEASQYEGGQGVTIVKIRR